MGIDVKDYRLNARRTVDLAHWPTRVAALYTSKHDYRELLDHHVRTLGAQQKLHYASNRLALLVVFQGMDASGKDGVIRHVMSGAGPQGCQVSSFKQPSPLELQHDFLWRTTCDLPPSGQIGIFNRSYYEEVLIVRVHPELLAAEALAGTAGGGEAFWRRRYRSIRNYERHLHGNGTLVLKIFLHISKAEQAKRLVARIDDPEKNWKFNVADIAEREYWDAYMDCYASCLGETSTKHAPWHVVPADDKKNARLIVSQIIMDTFADAEMSYPATTPERAAELEDIRRQLSSEGPE